MTVSPLSPETMGRIFWLMGQLATEIALAHKDLSSQIAWTERGHDCFVRASEQPTDAAHLPDWMGWRLKEASLAERFFQFVLLQSLVVQIPSPSLPKAPTEELLPAFEKAWFSFQALAEFLDLGNPSFSLPAAWHSIGIQLPESPASDVAELFFEGEGIPLHHWAQVALAEVPYSQFAPKSFSDFLHNRSEGSLEIFNRALQRLIGTSLLSTPSSKYQTRVYTQTESDQPARKIIVLNRR